MKLNFVKSIKNQNIVCHIKLYFARDKLLDTYQYSFSNLFSLNNNNIQNFLTMWFLLKLKFYYIIQTTNELCINHDVCLNPHVNSIR